LPVISLRTSPALLLTRFSTLPSLLLRTHVPFPPTPPPWTPSLDVHIEPQPQPTPVLLSAPFNPSQLPPLPVGLVVVPSQIQALSSSTPTPTFPPPPPSPPPLKIQPPLPRRTITVKVTRTPFLPRRRSATRLILHRGDLPRSERGRRMGRRRRDGFDLARRICLIGAR